MAKLHCGLTLLVFASENRTLVQDCTRGACTVTLFPNGSISECGGKR